MRNLLKRKARSWMARLNQDADREHERLLREYHQAQEKYQSLLPHAIEAPASRRVATIAFSEQDLELAQEADRQRLMAREALDRFRATHPRL